MPPFYGSSRRVDQSRRVAELARAIRQEAPALFDLIPDLERMAIELASGAYACDEASLASLEKSIEKKIEVAKWAESRGLGGSGLGN